MSISVPSLKSTGLSILKLFIPLIFCVILHILLTLFTQINRSINYMLWDTNIPTEQHVQCNISHLLQRGHNYYNLSHLEQVPVNDAQYSGHMVTPFYTEVR